MSSIAALTDAILHRNPAAAVAILRGNVALARTAGAHAKTPLHCAAEVDDVATARLLLELGADIEARTSWDATPLAWAATMGSARVAELLLARGARGCTLVVAAALGRLDDVRAIAESGADLAAQAASAGPAPKADEWPADTARRRGDVLSDALHGAARNGHVAVVEYLLGRGAEVDARGFFGATGLHWAAINGHAAAVALLLARGADPRARDARFGTTPAEWADVGKHEQIVATLRRHGAPA